MGMIYKTVTESTYVLGNLDANFYKTDDDDDYYY